MTVALALIQGVDLLLVPPQLNGSRVNYFRRVMGHSRSRGEYISEMGSLSFKAARDEAAHFSVNILNGGTAGS